MDRHHTFPGKYVALVQGLPRGQELLDALIEDLEGPGGVPVEDLVSWWKLVLIAYAGTPTNDVANWILKGEA
ncbi:MAG: hypothetical protein WEG36_11080 [Gemmatimonadota bacterium]